MLSKLISLLRRIRAVKWAFTRLRPLPHSGSIEMTSITPDASPLDIADAAPALDTDTGPLHDDADIAATAETAESDTAVSVIVESQLAAPSDINVSDNSSEEAPTELETVAVEETSLFSVVVESRAVEVSDLVVSSDTSPDLTPEVETVVAEAVFVTPVDVEMAAADVSDLVVDDDLSPGVSAEVEPVATDETPVFPVGAEVSVTDVPEISIDSDPSPGAATEIEPVLANDPPLITAVAAEDSTARSPTVATSIEPPPASQIRSAPKARAKAADPVDRAALIRQRWAETGIRMWNPRLHGTGEATLNIQGRIELLPPEPGETMPRYDKLEFKMLGGQIVCEGVIVEAPAHANQRSFTRLAEPGKSDRVREPVRERQAALA